MTDMQEVKNFCRATGGEFERESYYEAKCSLDDLDIDYGGPGDKSRILEVSKDSDINIDSVTLADDWDMEFSEDEVILRRSDGQVETKRKTLPGFEINDGKRRFPR